MTDNQLDGFERLARSAACESAPSIDISSRVLRTIRKLQVRDRVDRETIVFCYGALFAACAALLLVLQLPDDSLLPMAKPFISMLP